ncbi:MAG: hypothetical protein ACK55Z_14310, partial [bacterium]
MLCEIFVNYIIFEVLDVNNWKSTDHQLYFFEIEYAYEILRHKIVEPFKERIYLRLDALVKK